ncbi:hypothetical protein EDD66_10235 [Mobilisporobacter senegalensis]|uniref:Uncharacterized protein n=1 Tax=Mobilisporobacter senegalensis TaxID=1329262 RepID=A0A3N1XUT0_9FIRM|nr:hypothetical protein [Mobilisporobacter senegalensis]ROR30384.1 hypothetical protein EDD66_10235 [Mobilisporobacter senegalensis]
MSDKHLSCHLSRYIGETVTIFTTSGGMSGCGFTGLLLEVNCNYVRLLTERGSAPANPLSQDICPEMESYSFSRYSRYTLGSVCDIPTCSIASFCHNAV